MNGKENGNSTAERIKIQEEAPVQRGGYAQKKVESAEDIGDLQAKLKAIKSFLTRNIPEFKKQFPEIKRKLK